jgi:GAF domain-containing protein
MPSEPSAQDTGTTTGEDPLARSLSTLARSLQKQQDPAETLAAVVDAAVKLIPGVEEGSISVVVAHKEVSSTAASGDLPRQIDELQRETGEGPCLDAVYEQQTVRVTDMRTETRWPNFAQRASAAGAGSMLSFQLYVDDENLGALNLYSRTPNAFDDESEHVGLLFATHAAVAFAASQKQENFGLAIATRDLIGQAKGILMERYKLTSDEAFQLLVLASQRHNRKLRDIAEELTRSGELNS